MKKIMCLLFLFGIFVYVNVNASACQGDELTRLKEIADNIKINYEIENEGKSSERIKITLYNLNKDIYIIQKNDKDKDTKTINYIDGGKYTFYSNNKTDYIVYTFDVYSNVKTCDATLIKSITFKKPKLNPNYKYQICAENPTIPVCQKYITEDTGISENQLKEYIENYLSGQVSVITQKAEVKTGNFFKENLKYILIGTGVLGLVIGGYIFISKKRSEI